MKILLSNDDGVHAPGLLALASALAEIAEVQVVAPDRNRSGASNSLTLDRPLEPFVHENGFIGINGTPTDCVHLGVSAVFGMKPDMVIAGINAGANLGCDVLYSGTVAAATEGRHLKYPPMAVSLVGSEEQNYQVAAEVVRDLVNSIDKLKYSPRTILNINIPDLGMDQINGVHVTRSGHRDFAESPVASADPRGKVRYWISGAGKAVDDGAGTDFYAVEQGCISITPLQIDMTHYAGMDGLAGWLEEL